MTTVSQGTPRARRSWDVVADHLSAPRMQPYLAVTGQNVKRAMNLYAWNMSLSGALYEALHFTEVVLRNAMSDQLCGWNARQTRIPPAAPAVTPTSALQHSHDWLLDPSHLLERLLGDDIAKAKRYARRATSRRRTPVNQGDVLAQLSFNTWRFLMPSLNDAGRHRLWNEALQQAFPHLTGPLTIPAAPLPLAALPPPVDSLTASVERVYKLRNRVAHLEPMLSANVKARLGDMTAILEAVEPQTGAWLTSRQRVLTLLNQRPR